MRRSKSFVIVILSMVFLLYSIQSLAEIKLYDDFSTGYIDGTKWRQREYVREIVDGELEFKLGNRSPGMGAEIAPGVFRNNLSIANSETVNSIQCDITILETHLDSAIGSKSFIRIGGNFYNKNDTGGTSGDVFAQIMIGDQGNGAIEAFWKVSERLSDTENLWAVLGNGTIANFDSSIIDPPYRVKLSYDGDKTFVFIVNDIYMASYDAGPDKRRDAVSTLKAISAGIYAPNGLNIGYVHGKIDNVYINGNSTVYDDFSSPLIDTSKWTASEWVREASSGFLRANRPGFGSTVQATTSMSYRSAPYLEAKVRIDSTSQLPTGTFGLGRIQGYYYNDSRGPGSGQDHNQYEGDVFAQVRLGYESDGTLDAVAYVHRSEDATESSFTELFSHKFAVPINLDIFYTLSIRFDGNQFIFSCDGEAVSYTVTTPMYPAYGIHRTLRARIYLDPGETGNIHVSFDDVDVETWTGDLQPFDGDVDGSDLVAYSADDEGIGLLEFAGSFGQINKP